MASTIIFCEECGHRNEVPLEALNEKGKQIRCSGCRDILRIVRKNEKNPEVIVKKDGKDEPLF